MPSYSPLLTDQYQLVMAYNYWKLGMAEREAVFHLSFRKLPPQSSFIVAAGLQTAIEFLQAFKFDKSDLNYLAQLCDKDRLFPDDFLNYLSKLRFTCDLDVVREGNLVFGTEPILRISGPILQCQLLETPLLNFFNFASLIATKAAHIHLAAPKDTIIEFGLRRAQGPDGGLTASRSAYIGGCSATSNVLAGKVYDIPIQGTQTHSWILAFDNELEAFENFAEIMQEKTVLLVDTYDTIQGINHAIKIGQNLKTKGLNLAGIRLDSGNLLYLSRKARQLLDRADLRETKIFASGDLDEHILQNLKINRAPIDAWGIGTRLVTSFDYPALNAIYKLSALKNEAGEWQYKMKLSDDAHKATLPGVLQVRRFFHKTVPAKDVIYDMELGHSKHLNSESEDLLTPIFRQGELVYSLEKISDIRERAIQQVMNFALHAPKPYPVILDAKMESHTALLIENIKKKNQL